MKLSKAQILLEIHLRELGLEFCKEVRFAISRQWRFDYVLGDIDDMVALEIEGGIHARGRHVRGVGYEKDLEKYREAAARGWKVFRFSTDEVLKGVALEFLRKFYKGEHHL